MKVLQIHNKYRIESGENVAVEAITNLLKSRGLQVTSFSRNSCDVGQGLIEKIKAFTSGIYSLSAARQVTRINSQQKQTIAHVHNLYPLLSPSVLISCRRAGVPVVMSCHNYRLICPTGKLFNDGKICKCCFGGREYWCILKNCREDTLESICYALWALVARKLRFFHGNVTLFIAVSKFVKSQLALAGFDRNRIVVVPNMVHIPKFSTDPFQGKYVAFIGRLSPEKGVDTLLAAARQAELPIRLAGDYSSRHEYGEKKSNNIYFLGQLTRSQLEEFYNNARFLVIPSLWFETFGLVAAEAMAYGLPVIASKIGGLPEVVEDGVTGLLFEPGDSEQLAQKMKLMWENPELCRRMGHAGRDKAIHEYSEDIYYRRLITVYERAIEMHKDKRMHDKIRRI